MCVTIYNIKQLFTTHFPRDSIWLKAKQRASGIELRKSSLNFEIKSKFEKSSQGGTFVFKFLKTCVKHLCLLIFDKVGVLEWGKNLLCRTVCFASSLIPSNACCAVFSAPLYFFFLGIDDTRRGNFPFFRRRRKGDFSTPKVLCKVRLLFLVV